MKAATLVLIPGLLCDKTVWAPYLDSMQGTVPVHVADLTTQNTITQMAIDTLAVCHGNLLVAGHSMGARVAMEMVRLAPQRIRKLALLDTGIHAFQPGEEIRRNELVALAYSRGMRALADRWLVPMVHPDRSVDKQLMESLINMVEQMTPEIHEQQIHALLNRPDAVPGLASVSCPTLVLVGRQDIWSPVAQHKEICRLIPNSELAVIEDAGHFAPVEQPAQVNLLLGEWAQQVDWH